MPGALVEADEADRMRHFVEQLARVVTKIEEVLLAGGILGIAGLTIANVLTRTLFGHSLVFAEEISRFLIIVVTFLGLGYAAAQGRHIRMTAIYDQVPERSRKALRMFITGTTALLLFYFGYLSVRYAVGTVRELGSVSPALSVPLWIVYLAVPLGFVLAGIQYVLAFVKNLTSPGIWLSFEKKDEYEEPPPADI